MRSRQPAWGRFVQSITNADFVVVAADPVPEDPEQLSATLAKAGLSEIESWRFTDRFTERLEYEIDPNWRGRVAVDDPARPQRLGQVDPRQRRLFPSTRVGRGAGC
jgi:hypothetical protein